MKYRNYIFSRSRVWTLGALIFMASVGAGWAQFERQAIGVDGKETGWQRSASAGLTLTRGNSDTLTFTADVLAMRRYQKNEWLLGARLTYGEIEGDRSADSQHGFVQYNRLFNERLYGYLRADGLRDNIADLDYRFTLSPGVGYYLIKNERTFLSGEVGPAFIYEKQGGKTDSYAALRVAERLEHKFNEKTRLWQSFEYLPQVDDFTNYILNSELGLETDLTDKLSLRTYLQDTYDNVPAPGRKKNDLKLVTAIAYKF